MFKLSCLFLDSVSVGVYIVFMVYEDMRTEGRKCKTEKDEMIFTLLHKKGKSKN